MSLFDAKARDWDKNKMHIERAEAIALSILNTLPVNNKMKALEYGAGTGLLSFSLKDRFADITLMDNSQEMVRVAQEKIADEKIEHMRALWFDLEHSDYSHTFDIVYNQMVLHHVVDVETILKKFYSILNPKGFLAIADLYAEDGSFHGKDVTDIHRGFDLEKLSETLTRIGFKNVQHKTCYEVKRETSESFPIFLLTAEK